MTNLPNPFDSGVVSSPPDEAAALARSHAPSAAADLSCIGEIFIGAAKLEPVEIWFENAAYPREDELLYEVLAAMTPNIPGLPNIPDEAALLDAIDPLPIFLQKTA
jgi:hypothetical protein